MGLGGKQLGRCFTCQVGAIVWRKHFRDIVVSCCIHIHYWGTKELRNFLGQSRTYIFLLLNLASFTTFSRWKSCCIKTRCRSYCNYDFCRSYYCTYFPQMFRFPSYLSESNLPRTRIPRVCKTLASMHVALFLSIYLFSFYPHSSMYFVFDAM